MFRSATFKLTTYYLGIVMAISLLFSFALYHVTTGEVRRGLQMESNRITRQFPVFQDSPELMRPKADAEITADRIFWRLVSVNAIVFIGAGYASYMLAKRTLRPIEESLSQQARFTSDVSHELRTPLTAVRMESEVALLDKKTSTKELRETLKSNIEEVGKMEALINNLLRLTKLDNRQLQQDFSSVALNEAVQIAVDQTTRQARERDILINYKSPNKTVLTRGDHDSIMQMFVILLENAIKYSPNSSKVAITIENDQSHSTVRIFDQGIGIERDALEHVFDRFYRADNSRNKTDGEGYGLGLSIAKMIADVHGATITLSSQPGKGTTASVSFNKL